MNILKCQRNKLDIGTTNITKRSLKQLSKSLYNNSQSQLDSRNNTLLRQSKFYFSDNTFKFGEQISEKVNILSKHKSQIPERYMVMSPSLKNACIKADFPFYYEFQNTFNQKIIHRSNELSINLNKGEFFFMKNLVLLLNEYAIMESKLNRFKVQNFIICNDNSQVEFLEKIQAGFLHPSNGFIKDVDDPFFNINLDKMLPHTLILSKENFLKLNKKQNVVSYFLDKLLFFLYRLDGDDKGSLLMKIFLI